MKAIVRNTILGVIIIANLSYFAYVYLVDKSDYDFARALFLSTPENVSKPSYEDVINATNFQKHLRPLDLLNASALFNSVNSALKQKDSDIFPSGVSIFPASIPQGTLLYHAGTGFPDSFEWLAMDVEFSIDFGARGASTRGRKSLQNNRRHGPGGPGGRMPGKSDETVNTDMEPIDYCKPNSSPSFGGPGRSRNGIPMTLMSFQAKKNLDKLIYFDGASAAKTVETGEMDTQVLLSDEITKRMHINTTDDAKEHMAERIYADRICRWGKQFGLQGFVRLELGFELVICDFHENLDMVSNVSVAFADKMYNLPAPVEITASNGWPINCTDGSLIEDQLSTEQNETLALEDFRQEKLSKLEVLLPWEHARIGGDSHNRGDKRIGIDYRHLVTGFNRTYLDPSAYKRKLLNAPNATLVEMFDDLEDVVSHQSAFHPELSNNWQLRTEEIETKFTVFFIALEKILSNSKEVSLQERVLSASKYTWGFVKRFWSKVDEDYHTGKNFASWEYSYPVFKLTTESDFLIWSSLAKVVKSCVDTIYEAHDVLSPIAEEFLLSGNITELDSKDAQVAQLAKKITQFKDTLQWVSFGYECSKKCAWDEICYTPSWGPGPLGWMAPTSKVREGEQLPAGFKHDKNIDMIVIDTEQTCFKMDDLLRR
ncbi:hypothetical protein ACO0RG_003273 [Hanseniaspora osmophila]